MTSPADLRRGSWKGVLLVYRREIDARMTSKGYFISLLVMVIAVVGVVLGLDQLNSPKTYTVAVCGAPESAFGPAPDSIRVRPCTDLKTARAQTDGAEVDAAVAVHDGRVSVLVRADSEQQAQDAALAMGRFWAAAASYEQQHVNTARLNESIAQAGPHLVTVGHSTYDKNQLGAAISLVIVLFMQIIAQGSLVAQGVVEEKSTRIVEVLLSTLTPIRLMIGKVAGIGTAAIVQIFVLLGSLAGARAAMSGRTEGLPGTAALLSGVVWFLLSFALFAGLFAAAGSLVSRPEDLQSVLMPVMVIALAPVGVAVAAAGSLSASWVSVIQYVPPFSGLLMPLQASVEGVSVAQQLAAAAVMLLATAACMWLAARVYRNSILKIGTAVSWRQALAA